MAQPRARCACAITPRAFWWLLLIVAIQHAVQGALLLLYRVLPVGKAARVFALPLYHGTMTYNATATSTALAYEVAQVATLQPVVPSIFFALLTSAFTFARLLGWTRTIEETLGRRIDSLRWLEYAMSASLILVVIAAYSGILGVVELALIGGMHGVSMLLGWFAEAFLAAPRTDNDKAHGVNTTIVSWLAFAGAWAPIVYTYYQAVWAAGIAAVPLFVVLLLPFLLSLYGVFPVIFTCKCCRSLRGTATLSSDLRASVAYEVASSAAKTMFLALSYFGYNRFEASITDAVPDLPLESGVSQMSLFAVATGSWFLAALVWRHYATRSMPTDTINGRWPRLAIPYLVLAWAGVYYVMYHAVVSAGARAWVPSVLAFVFFVTQALYLVMYDRVMHDAAHEGAMALAWVLVWLVSIASFLALAIVLLLSPVWGGQWTGETYAVLCTALGTLVLMAIYDGIGCLSMLRDARANKTAMLPAATRQQLDALVAEASRPSGPRGSGTRLP